MISILLISLAICTLSWGSTSTCDLLQALNHIKSLKFTPQSLLSDFHLLCKFYPLIKANLLSSEVDHPLVDSFYASTNICFSQIKKLYEENSTKFILEVADSDPFLMGYFFRLVRQVDFPRITVYFQAIYNKLVFRDELISVSFDYVNSFIWREFKKPISVVNPWEDRILAAKAHIGILKRIQAIYPSDGFKIIENGIPTFRSMRSVIERLEFIIEEFKLYEGKIDPLDLVKVCGKIQSLNHKFKGEFNAKEAGPYLDLFKLLENHFMITPNDESILITIQPEILYLCIISFNNQDDKALFKHFGLSNWDLKAMAFESIPEKFLSLIRSFESKTVTVLSLQDHWQIKVYSRFECLEKSIPRKRFKN
jgi:hypothetical protein